MAIDTSRQLLVCSIDPAAWTLAKSGTCMTSPLVLDFMGVWGSDLSWRCHALWVRCQKFVPWRNRIRSSCSVHTNAFLNTWVVCFIRCTFAILLRHNAIELSCLLKFNFCCFFMSLCFQLNTEDRWERLANGYTCSLHRPLYSLPNFGQSRIRQRVRQPEIALDG